MAREEEGSWSNFEYTFMRRSNQYGRLQPCTVVAAAIGDGDVMEVPCFYCDGESHKSKEEYYTHYARQFSQWLVWAYPGMPADGADSVSENLKSVLQEANACHRLSCRMGKRFTTVHMVQFHIQPPVAFAEEGGKMKPASERSVTLLMAMKLVREEEERSAWRASECSICIDEIETWRDSLAMDCGHVFHQKCLCRWLSTSHFCPLCRFQMPTH